MVELAGIDHSYILVRYRNTSIFGKVHVFSDTVVCAFSEGAFGKILALI